MSISSQGLTTLETATRNGERVAVCEYLKVTWQPSGPAVVRYYGTAAFHEMVPFAGIGVEIDPRLLGSPFREYELQPDLRTQTIPLEFDDLDKEIGTKFRTYGSGITCELYLYYPLIREHVSMWFGQLQAPGVFGRKTVQATATNGHRSREQYIPRRMRPRHCPADFGGRFDSYERLNTNLCPYDRQLGGVQGLLNGAVPFTDCPRLTEADCTARFGHSRFYGGFNTDATATVSDGRSGYLAITKGNASTLKEPIRVVMGSKKVRGLQLLLWRREINASNPDRGFVATVWEVGEGPVRNIRNIKVKEKLIEQMHLSVRNGDRGQPAVANYNAGGQISNFSHTAHFSARYGWVNPLDITPADLLAEADVDGFREVPVFNATTSGPGLVGSYFADNDFLVPFATRIDSEINFPPGQNPPIEGIDYYGFSIRWTGKIKPRYSETYTFRGEFDNAMKLIINGVTVFDGTDYTQSPLTGTIALTADVEYNITIEFKQLDVQGYNPWHCVLKWQSASQALEVVPLTRLSNVGAANTFVRQWTNDRVWCLLAFYENQKFGLAYPLSRFDAAAWKAVSDWGLQQVTFSHTFPDGETRNYLHRRTRFDEIVEGRPVAEVVTDICRSGRISVPFQVDGKYSISEFGEANPGGVKAFYDSGDGRNISREQNGDTTLKLGWTPDDKLVNEITFMFEDSAFEHQERPITVDDPAQKLRAGRMLGFNNLQAVPMRFRAFGITTIEEAIKLAYGTLWFGQFDEGGTKNNLRATFITPLEHVLGLRRYQIITINSDLLAGFTLPDLPVVSAFRLLGMRKLESGVAEVTAQAYNSTAYTAFELFQKSVAVPNPSVPSPGPPPNPEPCRATLGTPIYDENGFLIVPILPC